MRAVVQRVSSAGVSVDGKICGEINAGLLVLLGVASDDEESDLQWLLQKIPQLRIFSDSEGKMNLSVVEAGGEILVVSQFTLYADCKKGNRPSYIRAARPELAIPMYEKFCVELGNISGCKIERGIFGADMKVSLLNDGPVTIVLDSRQRDF